MRPNIWKNSEKYVKLYEKYYNLKFYNSSNIEFN